MIAKKVQALFKAKPDDSDENEKQEGSGKALQVATGRAIARHKAEAQSRFLSHAAYLEEAAPPRFLNWTAAITSLTVAGFFGWAAITNVDEVTHASGEVVPSGFEQVIQHADGGIIESINVETGELVERGQVLVTIDDGATTDELKRARRRLSFMKMNLERLTADLSGEAPDFSQFNADDLDNVERQKDLFANTRDERESRMRIVKEQILQKKKDISILKGRLDTVQTSTISLKELLANRRALHKKGFVAYPLLVQTEQEVIRSEGEANKLTGQIEQAKMALSEYEERLRSIPKVAYLENSKVLATTAAEVEQLQATIDQLEARQKRLELKAPVRGLVKTLHVNSIGSVLKAGANVLSIVPVDEELVAETQISPRDVGHVNVGDPVQVKISSYDFTRYGIIPGKVDRISATTVSDDNGNRFYRVRVKLDKPYVGDTPDKNPIIPGMTVMANIKTGQRTILDYLLKPVRITQATAFSER